MTFKLSNKGQITIPKASRKVLGIKPHDRIKFNNNYKNHTVTIRKVANHHNIFNQPGLNYKNYKRFCRSQNMKTDAGIVGKENWRY